MKLLLYLDNSFGGWKQCTADPVSSVERKCIDSDCSQVIVFFRKDLKMNDITHESTELHQSGFNINVAFVARLFIKVVML